jgi:hypothetical protein
LEGPSVGLYVPLLEFNHYGKMIRAFVTQRNLIIRVLLLPSGSGISIFVNFP